MSQGKIEMSSCKLQVQVEFHVELGCIEASAESEPQRGYKLPVPATSG